MLHWKPWEYRRARCGPLAVEVDRFATQAALARENERRIAALRSDVQARVASGTGVHRHRCEDVQSAYIVLYTTSAADTTSVPKPV